MNLQTAAFGYPRIGDSRELKKTVEAYWDGKIDPQRFIALADDHKRRRLAKYLDAGIDSIPSNDFSLYDFVLDTSCMFGMIPGRFSAIPDGVERYFAMARGGRNAHACEMTKWFDTNYHYIVPEISGDIALKNNFPVTEFEWARRITGAATRPVIIGPFTFIASGKVYAEGNDGGTAVPALQSPRFKELLLRAAAAYHRVLRELEEAGAGMVQMDEPALVMDRSDADIDALVEAYGVAVRGLRSLKVIVHTYYDSLSMYPRVVSELPVQGIGLDFTAGDGNLDNIRTHGFPKEKILMAGVLSGRDPWKPDYARLGSLVGELSTRAGGEVMILSNAAPLFHLPVSVKHEEGHLDEHLISRLSFADERIEELVLLKEIAEGGRRIPVRKETASYLYLDEDVRRRVTEVNDGNLGRPHPFQKRYPRQMKKLGLPRFPTTTIGSFPQTGEVRRKRADYIAGRLSEGEYESFLQQQTAAVIRVQEDAGLDVLVHGELERSDMVEYFGQRLKGFAFTRNGWVQSYGTRCVRPPLIYGDVSRPAPMTVEETLYAQGLTRKPVKGIITGPVTILNWSFCRQDIPRKEIAYQLALALRDEVSDLEKAGIGIVQIDEPAFREGLPLKKEKQKEYLTWAVNAFKLTNEQVREETQVHAHMCYSEFSEIIDSILAMDTDVISIEASRSGGDILRAFEDFRYDHGIGLGVYDVHSPRVPTIEEMTEIMKRSTALVDPELLWINPDCGLKTRGYEETVPALKNMVAMAYRLRSGC